MGQHVVRDWFAVLASALGLAMVFTGVGIYMYHVVSVEDREAILSPTAQGTPLDEEELAGVSEAFQARLADYDAMRLGGVDVPDPGTVEVSLLPEQLEETATSTDEAI